MNCPKCGSESRQYSNSSVWRCQTCGTMFHSRTAKETGKEHSKELNDLRLKVKNLEEENRRLRRTIENLGGHVA